MDEKEILLDSDNDGIPDDWEINGYTVEEGNQIVKWDEKKHANQGYVKYFSDPYNTHTAGDPYSDLEKVLGRIDGLKEAHHPMVAAYPRINVEMEKIILSRNVTKSSETEKNTGQEKSNSVGLSTSNSHTDSTTVGVSSTVEAHASLLDFGGSVSVTGSFSNESSNTVSSEKSTSTSASTSSSTSIVNSLSLNASEVAFLNGNIRYSNIGTMPIYNLKPTLNFALGVGKNVDTISTISAKTNTLAKLVLPNAKYPDVNQNAVAWNTSDDFNSQPIKLNYEQVKDLADWRPLQIQTTQIDGQFKKYYQNGESYSSDDFNWSYYFGDIYSKTALLIVSFTDGQTFERRVAAVSAKQLDNKNQTSKLSIPQLTVQQALEIAFDGATIQEKVVEKEKKPRKEFCYKGKVLNKDNLHLVVDEQTNDILKKQDKDHLFDAVLTKEMKILLLEEDQTKEVEIFNKIVSHLQTFSGKDFNGYLDLQNKIGLDTNLGADGEMLKEVIRRHLLKKGFALNIVANLEIYWPYGIAKDKITLRHDGFKLDDNSTWYKNLKIKYGQQSSGNISVSYRNFLIEKPEDLKVVLNKITTTLKEFNGTNDDHRFDVNHLISFATDLGTDWQNLKQIVRTYLIFKGIFSPDIVNALDFTWKATAKNLDEDGFKASDTSNWYKYTKVKYQEWESEEFKFYFKNFRSSLADFLDQLSHWIRGGIDNWFKDFFKNPAFNDLAKASQLAKALGLISRTL